VDFRKSINGLIDLDELDELDELDTKVAVFDRVPFDILNKK
jgi:hypothetical protein